MNTRIKLPATILLLATPAAAYAQGAPHILYAMAGGAVGGFVGALAGCWLCNRMRSKKDDDPRPPTGDRKAY